MARDGLIGKGEDLFVAADCLAIIRAIDTVGFTTSYVPGRGFSTGCAWRYAAARPVRSIWLANAGALPATRVASSGASAAGRRPEARPLIRTTTNTNGAG
jgi:hypothetical protein